MFINCLYSFLVVVLYKYLAINLAIWYPWKNAYLRSNEPMLHPLKLKLTAIETNTCKFSRRHAGLSV